MFYNNNGSLLNKFDYSHDEKVKEFTIARFNPSGETCVIGNFNRFYVYTYVSKRAAYEESIVKIVENLYSVTALSWKPDSSKLYIGSLCGSVDAFECCMKKCLYKQKFEFT